MRPDIKWDKWEDPFDISNNNREQEDDDDDEERSPYQDIEEERYSDGPILSRFISGPMGGMPLNENCLPGKMFNFWVCHTNFNVTRNVVELIKNIDGVEGLQILSRYRFRIAIGKMFDEGEVKDEIRINLCGPEPAEEAVLLVMDIEEKNDPLTPEIDAKLQDTIKKLKDEYWAVFVVPNGQIRVLKSDEVDHDFVDKLRVFVESQEAVGGAILTSLLPTK